MNLFLYSVSCVIKIYMRLQENMANSYIVFVCVKQEGLIVAHLILLHDLYLLVDVA